MACYNKIDIICQLLNREGKIKRVSTSKQPIASLLFSLVSDHFYRPISDITALLLPVSEVFEKSADPKQRRIPAKSSRFAGYADRTAPTAQYSAFAGFRPFTGAAEKLPLRRFKRTERAEKDGLQQ